MAGLDVDVALKVGIQGVDKQHKAIARMIDAIAGRNDAQPTPESISETMTAIGRLIREHFNSEEKVLEQLGAPAADIEAHKNDHARLIDEYVDLLLMNINSMPIPPSRLRDLLQSWMTDHIVKHDLKIRDYLAPHIRA